MTDEQLSKFYITIKNEISDLEKRSLSGGWRLFPKQSYVFRAKREKNKKLFSDGL